MGDVGPAKAKRTETMDNDQQGVAGSEANVPPTGGQTQMAQPSGAPTDTQRQADIVEELPETPDKQKEAFIKMRLALKEKEDLLKQYQSQDETVEDEIGVINQFRQGAFAPQTPITPDTGIDEFSQRVAQAEQVAYQSNQRIESLERELEDQRLFAEFPELNPKNEQSKTPQARAFEEYVAGKAALDILKGNKPDLVSIARKAKDSFSGMSSAQKDAVAQEVRSEIQTKEHATLEAKGTSFIPQQAEDMESVNRRIWKGDMDALAYRLKKRG